MPIVGFMLFVESHFSGKKKKCQMKPFLVINLVQIIPFKNYERENNEDNKSRVSEVLQREATSENF